jgi:ATP-dependent exoDNAse (exonuclease V) alpha subunit
MQALNQIRQNEITAETVNFINQRVLTSKCEPPAEAIHLTTTNRKADQINEQKLNEIDAPSFHFKARVDKTFPRNSSSAPEDLVLKNGARVMMLINDSEHRFINGSTGYVTEIEYKKTRPLNSKITVLLDETQEFIQVSAFEFNSYRNDWNASTGSLEKITLGSFVQLPIRLAWAVTIHKAQGKTFESMIVNFGQGSFAGGQTYVALSRVKTLEKLYLVKGIQQRDVFVDPVINQVIDTVRAVNEKAQNSESKTETDISPKSSS